MRDSVHRGIGWLTIKTKKKYKNKKDKKDDEEERITNKTIRSNKVLTHRVSTTHLLNRQIMSVFCYSNSLCVQPFLVGVFPPK